MSAKQPIESTQKKSGNLFTIVALLAFVALLAASYTLKDMLKPIASAKVEPDESCDLRKGLCTSNLPSGGSVSFSIAPNDIPLLRPLKLDVKVDGVKVSKAEVDFIGIGMDMGYNRSELEPITSIQFKGEAVLPVCMRSKMDWEARVLLETDNGLIMVPFRFFTIK